MGGLMPRARAPLHSGPETPVNNSNRDQTRNPYGYPPANGGSYFATHYYLGHRKFETGDPEVFLFGDLSDINFLNPKPVTFPYKQPGRNQPLNCLRSYINIHRDSVKLDKVEGSADVYTLEFRFDSDVDCRFTVYTKVPDSVDIEDLRSGSYSSDEVGVSRSFHYSAGCDQQFEEKSFTIRPDEFGEELAYDAENDQTTFPVVILMETDSPEAPESQQQAHVSICNLDRVNDNGYSIKTFKQKLVADGIEYLLQEIYGLENKAPDEEQNRSHDDSDDDDDDDDDDDIEELGAECVICITDVRDTLLLPCRHLCLCAACAANLRYQSSNCPVCRAPFRALLQIQALQPLDPDELIDDDEITGNPKYSTPGFQCVPLLQALNGYNLERDDVGPEPRNVSSPESATGDDGERDQQEEGEEQQQSEARSATPQTTTSLCVVVPIEDSEQDSSSEPAKSPVRTDLSRRHLGDAQSSLFEETSIPLPGTPTSDDEHVNVMYKHRGGGSGQLALNIDIDQSTEAVPDSPSSSRSFSSRGSTKSTDVLLPKDK